jgi:hypothetical protein
MGKLKGKNTLLSGKYNLSFKKSRIEELCPFPQKDVIKILEKYKSATGIIHV